VGCPVEWYAPAPDRSARTATPRYPHFHCRAGDSWAAWAGSSNAVADLWTQCPGAEFSEVDWASPPHRRDHFLRQTRGKRVINTTPQETKILKVVIQPPRRACARSTKALNGQLRGSGRSSDNSGSFAWTGGRQPMATAPPSSCQDDPAQLRRSARQREVQVSPVATRHRLVPRRPLLIDATDNSRHDNLPNFSIGTSKCGQTGRAHHPVWRCWARLIRGPIPRLTVHALGASSRPRA